MNAAGRRNVGPGGLKRFTELVRRRDERSGARRSVDLIGRRPARPVQDDVRARRAVVHLQRDAVVRDARGAEKSSDRHKRRGKRTGAGGHALPISRSYASGLRFHGAPGERLTRLWDVGRGHARPIRSLSRPARPEALKTAPLPPGPRVTRDGELTAFIAGRTRGRPLSIEVSAGRTLEHEATEWLSVRTRCSAHAGTLPARHLPGTTHRHRSPGTTPSTG
jgi:hypothetical protein